MENILIAEHIRSYIPEAGPVSLAIAPGEWWYLQGRDEECNALFEMLTGLRRPEEGTVTLLGEDLYALKERERAAFRRDHIGAIPTKSGFVPELTLLEQVRLPNAFVYLPLYDLYNPAKRCSQRTLALAGLLRALVMEPKVLILNAPFDHLNRKDAMLVWQEVQTVLVEDMAFVYLSSAPAPGDIPWTEIQQISGR